MCGVAVTLFVFGFTSSATFGAYNTAWDGGSEIRTAASTAGAETTVAQNVSAYTGVEANRTLAVILSPTESYDGDTEEIQRFIDTGGTLLLAEDYGPGGNELLEALNAEARVAGTPLRDEQRAGPSPAFPRAASVTNHTYTDGVDSIMLNHGTAIEPRNATTLFASSSFSYLDTTPNEQLDSAETLSSRPVVTIESIGDGTLIVVSDPSIFINAMVDRADNRAFLTAVVTAHEHVLLDVSHTEALPPLVQLQLLLQKSPGVRFLAGSITLVAIVVLLQSQYPAALRRYLYGRLRTEVERPQLSNQDIKTTLRERHPEWDEQRIERVTNSLMAYRRQRTGDD